MKDISIEVFEKMHETSVTAYLLEADKDFCQDAIDKAMCNYPIAMKYFTRSFREFLDLHPFFAKLGTDVEILKNDLVNTASLYHALMLSGIEASNNGFSPEIETK